MQAWQRSMYWYRQLTCTSSPHLMQVRERIRINSEPLAHDLFCKYFWVCWDMLHEHPTHLDDCEPLPPYFRFLTLVSLKVWFAGGA